MNKQQEKKEDVRRNFLSDLLSDMADEVAAGSISDAVRVGYLERAIKAMKELDTLGVKLFDVTDSAFLRTAAIKAGVEYTEKTRETGLEARPETSAAAHPDTQKGDPQFGADVKSTAPGSPPAEVKATDVAQEAVQEGRDANSSGESILRRFARRLQDG